METRRGSGRLVVQLGALVAGTAGQPPAAPPARRRYPTGAIVLIGIGVAFLLQDYLGGNALPALILIAIGVALVVRPRAAP